MEEVKVGHESKLLVSLVQKLLLSLAQRPVRQKMIMHNVQDVDEIAVEHNVGAIGSGAAIFWVKKLSQKVKKRLRKVRKRMKG